MQPDGEPRFVTADHRPAERLYVASANQHKLAEIASLFAPLAFDVRSCRELGATTVREDGRTFLANARKKVRPYLPLTDAWVLADDSGLEVPALGGEPGVHSARYAGVNAERAADAANNAKLLDAMRGLTGEARRARFVCTIALGHGGAEVCAVRATVEGVILSEPRGTRGFGYDPLFLYPALGETFAELDAAAKNRVSHRGRALAAVTAHVRTFLRGRQRLGALAEKSA
jgi:XTP/dITP diphosphohydrolase